MRRTTTIALCALLLGSLAACGDDDSTDDGASPTDDEGFTFQTDAEGNVTSDPDDIPDIGEGSGDDGDDAGGGEGGSGAVGTMTIDGVEIGFDDVLRCEEDSSDLDDIERMLEIFYTGGDYRLDLFTSEIDNVGVSQSMHLASPDGRFNGGALEGPNGWFDSTSGTTSDEPAYTLDGNRITGSATLSGDFDPDMLVEVSFDAVFPDETRQCR